MAIKKKKIEKEKLKSRDPARSLEYVIGGNFDYETIKVNRVLV